MAFDEQRGEVIRGKSRGREVIPPGHIANVGDFPLVDSDTGSGQGTVPVETAPESGDVSKEGMLQFFVECWRDAGIDRRRQ